MEKDNLNDLNDSNYLKKLNYFNNLMNNSHNLNDSNNSNNLTISVILVHTGGSHLLNILNSINHSKYNKDLIEVIIVENISDESHERSTNYLNKTNKETFDNYQFTIKLLKVSTDHKNTNILFNVGIKYATGEVILFNETEIIHVGDVISAAAKFTTDTNYVTFPVLKLPTDTLNPVLDTYIGKVYKKMDEVPQLHFGGAEALSQINSVFNTDNFWLSHPLKNPTNYYYLSSIKRQNLLTKLNNGFNEEFANGFEYHDKEFLDRVYNNNLTVHTILPGKMFPMGIKFNEPKKDFDISLIETNKNLFEKFGHVNRLNHPFKIIKEL